MDILGEPDAFGNWGKSINYVSLDLDGSEPYVLGCVDLKTYFSSESKYQVWNIPTSNLSAWQLRYVDASMLFGGYSKAIPNLDETGLFHDDIYIMMRGIAGDPSALLPQHRCSNGKPTCSFSEIMTKQPFAKPEEAFLSVCS
jgi:hypothetical protein